MRYAFGPPARGCGENEIARPDLQRREPVCDQAAANRNPVTSSAALVDETAEAIAALDIAAAG